MKKIMHIVMLSCLRATEFIEKNIGGDLSFIQKVQLKMHISVCKACYVYKKQSVILDKALNEVSVLQDKELDMRILKESIMAKINQSK